MLLSMKTTDEHMTQPMPAVPRAEESGARLDRLWTVREAAAFLSVSPSWIYHEAEKGELPHVRIGSMLRFEPETLREYARSRRSGGTHRSRR
jgi:excisionase family DNA binding protein